MEHLVGAPSVDDEFVLTRDGSVSAGIDGGAAGWDTLVIQGRRYRVESAATDPHSGRLVLDGIPLVYAGLELITIPAAAAVMVITLTGDDDNATLSMVGGQLGSPGSSAPAPPSRRTTSRPRSPR